MRRWEKIGLRSQDTQKVVRRWEKTGLRSLQDRRSFQDLTSGRLLEDTLRTPQHIRPLINPYWHGLQVGVIECAHLLHPEDVREWSQAIQEKLRLLTQAFTLSETFVRTLLHRRFSAVDQTHLSHVWLGQ